MPVPGPRSIPPEVWPSQWDPSPRSLPSRGEPDSDADSVAAGSFVLVTARGVKKDVAKDFFVYDDIKLGQDAFGLDDESPKPRLELPQGPLSVRSDEWPNSPVRRGLRAAPFFT